MEKLNDKKGKFKFISRKYTDNAIAKMTNINRKKQQYTQSTTKQT